jgi:hypothetical protein
MIAIAISLIACVLVAAMAIAWKLHQPTQPVAVANESSTPSAADLLASAPKPKANVPEAPGVIATEDELAKPWASKAFEFRDPITGADVPALVVHLPRGGYWGFSMIEPYGTCQLEYVTDMQHLQSAYGYEGNHPMVGDPCSRGLFDLLQYGGPPGAEVRGAPVHGMGVRPPLAIEIEQHGKDILAVKME